MRRELLLLGEPRDPRLEVVVAAPQPLGLAPVAGGAVGTGQDVQPLELVARVADVAAYGGVGPLAAAVAVEAQVQLDQVRDRVDLVAGEPQRLHPLAGHLRAHHVVVVEGDGAVVEELAGARLADVVHQRGEPDDQVRRPGQPVLEVDRLLEHRQGVLVDVLVPVVLVGLERERRQLGQHQRSEAGLDEQRQAAPGLRRHDQLDQLVPYPLGGDDPDPLRHRGHRRDHLGRDLEPELGGEPGRAHHPQRVVGERVLGRARGAQQPVREVDHAAVRVLEAPRRGPTPPSR